MSALLRDRRRTGAASKLRVTQEACCTSRSVCHVGNVKRNAVDPTAKERNVFLDGGGTDLPRTVIMEGETAFTSLRA